MPLYQAKTMLFRGGRRVYPGEVFESSQNDFPAKLAIPYTPEPEAPAPEVVDDKIAAGFSEQEEQERARAQVNSVNADKMLAERRERRTRIREIEE